MPMQAPERHLPPLFHHLYIHISYWSGASQVKISTITEASRPGETLDLEASSQVANSELITYNQRESHSNLLPKPWYSHLYNELLKWNA